MAKKVRNSNIEFLRIVSMLFIVCGHMINQGGIGTTGGKLVYMLLGSGARIAVNIFLLIGVWFMVGSKFKAKRVIDLYINVWIYTVPITVVMVILQAPTNMKAVVRGFFPLTGHPLWFVAAYITLLLLSPYLNKALKLDSKAYGLLVALLSLFICGIATLPGLQDGYLCDSLWFLYVYLLIGWLKNHIMDKIKKINSCWFLGMGVFIYVGLVIARWGGNQDGVGFDILRSLSTQYLTDIKSFPNFLCALSFFLFVVCIPEKENEFINSVAQNTLDVYIIHQIPAFITFLWFNIFNMDCWEEKTILVKTILTPIIIFIACSFIGELRKIIVNKFLVKVKLYRKAEECLRLLYTNECLNEHEGSGDI